MKRKLLILLFFLSAPILSYAQVTINLPDTVVSSDSNQLVIPVKISDTDGADIYGYSMQFTFDPEVISITGFSVENTLSASFLTFENTNTSGVYFISGAGSEAINSDGVLVNIIIETNSLGTSELKFADLLVNEGSPEVISKNGSVVVNTNPVVKSGLGMILLDEDFDEFFAANLDTVFFDQETDSLSFDLFEHEENILIAEIEGNLLRLVPVENRFGSTKVIVTATDENQLIVYDTLSVVVKPVNDVPYISDLPDTVTIIAGEDYKLEGLLELIGDVEDSVSELSLSIVLESDDAISATLNISEGFITISGEVGTGVLKVTVSDQDGGETTVSVQIEVILLDAIEDQRGTPYKVILSQNYPNPFNPSTNINFTLPLSSEVSIKVYDLTGREVATVIDKRMTSGMHSVSFDASSLTSGVYFYKLVTTGFSETKQMLLIK